MLPCMGDDTVTNWREIDWDAVDWRHLGEHLERRVEDQLRIPWAEFERRSGLSGTALRNVRQGRKRRMYKKTADSIEFAAQWRPGSFVRTLLGGEPTPEEEGEEHVEKEGARSGGSVGASSLRSVGADDSAQPPRSSSPDADLERFRRWTHYVGSTFTPAAFLRMQEDFAEIYREGYEKGAHDAGGS